MIFVIYINNATHINTQQCLSSLPFVSFCMSEGLSDKVPSPEVNTRGKQAHSRAVTHAIRYKEGTRHWASRVLLVQTRTGIHLAFCGTYNDSCY